MIRHKNIAAEPSSMCWTVVGEVDQSFMNGGICEQFSAFVRACSNEINWRVDENRLETIQSLLSGEFGGHRPPLQISEFGQQLFVDVVEAAITEHHHDIFLFQHRNDSIDNRRGVLFVKRRPAI